MKNFNTLDITRSKHTRTRTLCVVGLLLLLTAGAILTTPQHARADAPTIVSVSMYSDAGSDDTYFSDDNISAKVTFSEAVNVKQGQASDTKMYWPGLNAYVNSSSGSDIRYYMPYTSGSGTTELIFTSYTLTNKYDPYDMNGLRIAANYLTIPGQNPKPTDLITATNGGENANLAHSGVSESSSHKVDGTKSNSAPKVTFTAPTDTQGGATFDITIAFDQVIENFSAADDVELTTTLTNGTGSATSTITQKTVTGNTHTEYKATITPPSEANGTITLKVKKQSVNPETAPSRLGPNDAQSTTVTFDTRSPTLTYTEPTGVQKTDTFDVPITFNVDVTGFAASDITVTTTRTSGSGDATVALSGSGTAYTATVTSPTDAVGTITLEVAADAVTAGTRTGPASKATSDAISFDTAVATVSFTEPAGIQSAATFTVPITVSKSVTGFAASDITVTTTRTSGSGDATVALSGSGTAYTATVTSPTNAVGTITLEVAVDAFNDGNRDGPASATTSSAINFDTTPPTVTFTKPTGTQTADSFDIGITFSKSVTGFILGDLKGNLTADDNNPNNSGSLSLSGSGASYTATFTSPTNAKGTFELIVKANSVNDGTRDGPASQASTGNINYDTKVATVSFTEPAGVQSADTFDVPITFSKSVTGFATTDITLTSSTGTASFTLSGSGTSYTATVTSPTNATGTITLAVAANAVTDGSNRTGPTSKTTSDTINFDTTTPTVSFTEPAGTQAAATFDVPITFSKSVTGFATTDITLTSSTGTASFTLSGSGKDYTATVTSPTNAKGTITLAVAANAATDSGNRTGPAAKTTSNAIAFDTTIVTVSFTEPAGTQTTNTFTVPITFSKSITGFTATSGLLIPADLTVTTTRTSGSGDATVTLSGSGKDYTATVTSPTNAKGTITLAVAKDGVTDGTRTGPAAKTTSNAISFDTTVATVSFTEPAGTQTGDTFDVPITFSKSVTGFATSDLTLTSSTGSASFTLSGSGTSYTAKVTSPTNATGTITLAVAKDAATDGTRTGPAAKTTSNAINFDTTVATVSFSEPNGTQVADTFDVPITFSKSVTGFDTSDLTLTSSTGSASFTLSGSGKDYTATVTSPTSAKGTITLAVAKNAATDGARTGPAAKTTSNAINFDTRVATVSFTEPQGTQVADTFDVGINFSKSVTGFATTDLTLTSSTGTASFTLSGSGTSYTATVTSPTNATGTITLAVAKDGVTDGTRTGPAAKTTSNAINFDTTVATVTFIEPTGTQTANTFDVWIRFSKDVTGFEAGDLTVTSSTGSASFTLSGSYASYIATVTSPTSAQGTITLAVKKGAVTDSTRAGPPSKATSDAINFDTRVATVSFSEPAGTQTADTFDVPITFSKSVTGFAASDITVTSSSGTASVALSGSGTSYTATVTSPTAAKGTITLAVAKDAATDGTRTAPASKTTSDAISFDTTVPTLTFKVPSGVQTANSFDVGITFSKPVTGLALSDISLVKTGTGTLSFRLSGSGANYTVTIQSPTTAKGTVKVEVAKDAVTDSTRTGPATKQTSAAISYDTTAPTLAFVEPQGVQTADSFRVGINFSKSVTGFESSDITIKTAHTSGSGTAKFTLSGSGTNYTATITSPTAAKGTVQLTVAKNAATDGVRHVPTSDTASNTIDFDTTRPTLTFNEPKTLQTGDTFDVPIKFSKDVSGFVASDITVTSSTGTASVKVSGSGQDYTATVTSPTNAAGTITLAVAANAVNDGVRTGPPQKTTSAAINFDTTTPTVSFTEPAGTQTADTFDVPITFSKSVTGFAASDVTIKSSTGTASFTLSGSGKDYTATVTSPTAAKGTITLAVAKDAATDGTRTGPASKTTSNAIDFDTTVATLSFTVPQGLQTANSFDVGITFSKSVTGLTSSDIRLVKTGTGTLTFSLSGSGTAYTVTIQSPTTAKGTVKVEVAKDAATDGTRTGPATKQTSPAINFDTTAPTVRFTEPQGVQIADSFSVGITFSKSVTGFESSDITITTTRTSGSGNATFALSGSGKDYTATITSPTAAKGTVQLTIAANAATDGTRNVPTTDTTSKAISFDTTIATVSFTEPTGVQKGDTFDVPITFSKSVTGFAASDMTVTSSTGTATVSVNGSGQDYTATVTPPTNTTGTITLMVAADAVTDGIRTAPDGTVISSAIHFDTTPPTVSLTRSATGRIAENSLNAAVEFYVHIFFSRSVTGFEAADITLKTTHTSGTGNATLTLAGAGADYMATITPPADAAGSIGLTVNAHVATDGTRTGPTAPVSTTIPFDRSPPPDTNPPTDPQPPDNTPPTDPQPPDNTPPDNNPPTTPQPPDNNPPTDTPPDGTQPPDNNPPTDTPPDGTQPPDTNPPTDTPPDNTQPPGSTPPTDIPPDNTQPTDTSLGDTQPPDSTHPTDTSLPSTDTQKTLGAQTSQPIGSGDGTPVGQVIFNELYNASTDENDWIELKNIGDGSINLKDWNIGLITGSGDTLEEIETLTLPEYALPPNGILLIVNTAPSETPIAAGINISTGEADANAKTGEAAHYFIAENFKLPVGDYCLTLRDQRYTVETSVAIVDTTGTYVPRDPKDASRIWPLHIQKTKVEVPEFTADTAWRRVEPKIVRGYLAEAWTASRYQYARGYDTEAPTALGTPGHPNDYPVTWYIDYGPVAISEIMYAQRNAQRTQPQWIELYNTGTEPVDLNGWQLHLEVYTAVNATLTLKDVEIRPKQTLLIVTKAGVNSGQFPAHKVYDLSTVESNVGNVAAELLSSTGFSLRLADANGQTVDRVGNLDGNPATMDTPTWQLPSGQTETRSRYSLVRRYKDKTPRPGTVLFGWYAATELNLSLQTYYGAATDVGNPGYRRGGYLPVSLSQFSAKRTERGVVLNWATESELNNAGFNIYRSETRDGKFTQVNTALIGGAGTTSERQAYVWKDTTAKLNVAYYYRIEDVAFSGVHQELRTVRMRGHVSAAGKQLATWGALKLDR